jgi:hypothetical protein
MLNIGRDEECSEATKVNRIFIVPGIYLVLATPLYVRDLSELCDANECLMREIAAHPSPPSPRRITNFAAVLQLLSRRELQLGSHPPALSATGTSAWSGEGVRFLIGCCVRMDGKEREGLPLLSSSREERKRTSERERECLVG